MRDDIHNKAPISAALRRVLRQALRPADQLAPERLRDNAIFALLRELELSLPKKFLESLRLQIHQGTLFDIPSPCYSQLQANIVDHLHAYRNSTSQEACEAAVHIFIESTCTESEAAMLAAGGNRAEIREGIKAFNAALFSATAPAVKYFINKIEVNHPNHMVTPAESLSLGRSALEYLQ